jgi:hypothetical protein
VLNNRIKAALVVLAASAGLSACSSYGPYGGSGVSVGVGYGSGYGGYGYGGGYGGYGYGSPYGYGYGNGYGGYPYYGWYDGFYYPGSGYWVYDRDGHHHPINHKQSSFWGNQLKKYREAHGTTAQTQAAVTQNFSGFRARAKSGATIRGVNLDAQAQAQGQADQTSVRQITEARRQAREERVQQAREQRATQTETRSESRGSIRERMIERRRARSGGGGE